MIDTILFLRPELERRAPKITGLPALDAFILGAALDFVLFVVYLWLIRPREQDIDWPGIIDWAALLTGSIVLVWWLGLFMMSLFMQQV